ncbi:hypothetical protein ACFWY5_49820 [Nonomuraea sp. NPDC059007]|uniref:hypothetical protein n=1 Tax=Nonomuraea sp. NPDC059007 TaxID=3346692 RepID=UPI0036D1118D
MTGGQGVAGSNPVVPTAKSQIGGRIREIGCGLFRFWGPVFAPWTVTGPVLAHLDRWSSWAASSPPTASHRREPSRRPARRTPSHLIPARPATNSIPTPPDAVSTKSWCAAPSPTSGRATNSAPGTEDGLTPGFLAAGRITTLYEAARAHQRAATPAVVPAGEGYGAGSSRDWAAKGPALLGVNAFLAKSFERIHRSNLVGMGVLPLRFLPGEYMNSLQKRVTLVETGSGLLLGL